ncbi:uncharacterized protein CDAR_224291 [Caerostris darwini]|uniref:Uncharacterized protein n=1 Tax=Caerostris darwini TaxID=1538125 RepID=A0AAV4Q4H6_9ARAC|nr:uncharacterized protein CDAR_224291 [Caerostris darwini]
MVKKPKMILHGLFLLALFQMNLAGKGDEKSNKNNENSLEAIAQNPNHPDYVFVKWNNSDYLTKASVDQSIKKLMAFMIRENSDVKISGPCMSAFFRAFQAIRKQTPWAYARMYLNFQK